MDDAPARARPAARGPTYWRGLRTVVSRSRRNEMKGLVFLTNIPAPYRCTFYNELAKESARNGVGLTVLYCARTEPNRHWQISPSAFLHEAVFLDRGFHPTIRGVSFHFNLGVGLVLRGLQPDLVVCAGSWNMPTNWLALRAARAIRARTVFWSEGHADAVRHPAGPVAWMRRRFLRAYDAYAVPNRRSADWILSEAGQKRPVVLLPNTVDGEFYRRRDARERQLARNKLGIPASTRLLVQVSGLEPWKGVRELLTAFVSLRSELATGAMLVLLGDGSLRGNLERGIDAAGCADRVKVVGHVDQERVREWLMAADAFVLNSFLDKNPLAPIEASFAKLPLLLSARVGNHDELLTAATGFSIADPSNPGGVLERFFETEWGQLSTMGEAAYDNAARTFAIDSVCAALLEQLDTLVSGRD
jgi:glycosyltransferase involved in cell wall biosynthesis